LGPACKTPLAAISTQIKIAMFTRRFWPIIPPMQAVSGALPERTMEPEGDKIKRKF
jgi:hypothetical protein